MTKEQLFEEAKNGTNEQKSRLRYLVDEEIKKRAFLKDRINIDSNATRSPSGDKSIPIIGTLDTETHKVTLEDIHKLAQCPDCEHVDNWEELCKYCKVKVAHWQGGDWKGNEAMQHTWEPAIGSDPQQLKLLNKLLDTLVNDSNFWKNKYLTLRAEQFKQDAERVTSVDTEQARDRTRHEKDDSKMGSPHLGSG